MRKINFLFFIATVIFCVNFLILLLILLYVFDFAFFFLLSRKKEEETHECFAFCKKKKESPWQIFNGSLSQALKNVCAIISTKMLAHASHFRDVLGSFWGKDVRTNIKRKHVLFSKKTFKYSLTLMPSRCQCQRSFCAAFLEKRVFPFSARM